MNRLTQMLQTKPLPSVLLIRLMVGLVFLSEGIQKFLFPAIRGAGRFEKIGLPNPEFLGDLVGIFEILGGTLVLIGLFTRFASLPLVVIIIVAIITTKSTVLLNEGFWPMLHGSRTDWSMLLGSVYLMINGGGKWSFDLLLFKIK